MNDSKYMSQTDLGKRFGVSSHTIGSWLKKIGLRTPEGWPTHQAKQKGFTTKAPNGRGTGSFDVWHAEKTLQALEEAGHKRLDKGSPLVGPFSTHQREDGKYEIHGSDAAVNLWVRGKANADAMIKLLNLAHQHGKLNGQWQQK